MLYNVVNEPSFGAKCLRDLTDLIAKGVLSLFLVLCLVWASWETTVLTALVGALLGLLQWRASHRYSYAIGKKRIQLNQQVAGLAAESLAGARQLKIFCVEGRSIRLFEQGLRRMLDLLVKIEVVQELPKVIGEIIIVGLLIGVLLYCLAARGDEASDIIPKIGLFVVCGQRLLTNVSDFLSQRIAVISYWPSLKLVSELAANTEFREDTRGGKMIDSLRDGVTLRDVLFSYGDGKILLDDLNLEFRKGQMVAIVGPSGSGKSTVCDLLIGLRSPNRGHILVDGESLSALDIRSWRRLVGYVSQDTFLFNVSVRENILYGNPDADQDTVRWAARAAGVDDFIDSLSLGYNTVVGERGVCLSGGQRQRLAIARTLVRNPDMLIFDEATSALDSQSEERIFELVEGLRRDKAIVVVTHKLRWLSVCDRIYVMEAGRVVESGSYDELIRVDGLFAKLERMSFEVKEGSEVLGG
jgi:subfamily B ATP-binding cassette protein MsbA